MTRLALVVIALAIARGAWADSEADAEQAFRAAEQRAAANEAEARDARGADARGADARGADARGTDARGTDARGTDAIDALEEVGARRPVTRWTDDAWLEAARLAERAGDFDRARRDLREAIAVTTDEQLARRAHGALDRIEGFTGTAGQWSEIAARHERLAARVLAGGDPQPALGELEALVRSVPGYPRAAIAMLVIAQGHERDGDADGAIAWLREARKAEGRGADRLRATTELVRALIRHASLDEAAAVLDVLAEAGAAPLLVTQLRSDLHRATERRTARELLWGVLAALALVAMVALRWAAGSWRATARLLVRPPIEVAYLAPIALVLVAVAQTGNPMVARAVRSIAIAGVVVTWISGAILETRGSRPGLARALAHAVLAALAVGAATWLAIDHDRMIDLVVETWRSGPAAR